MKTLINLLLIVLLVGVGSISAQEPSAEQLVDEGMALFWEGDFEGALDLYNQAVSLEPDNADYLSRRCAAYLNLRDVDAAAADCARALELDPESALAHGANANLYMDNEYEGFDLALALEEANRGVELAPDSWLAHFVRGTVLASSGAPGLALDAFDRAIELGMSQPLVYIRAGSVASFNMRDFERGLAYFEAGQELFPDNVQLIHRHGVVQVRLGDYEAALLDVERSLELDPDFAPAYLETGLISGLLGDEDAALEGYLGWLERIEQERIEQDIAFGEVTSLEMTWGRVFAFPVELDAEAVISIMANGSPQVDPLIFVLDADGTALMYNDDIVINEDMNATLRNLTLPAGSYTVLVSHAGGGSDGIVRVTVRVAE